MKSFLGSVSIAFGLSAIIGMAITIGVYHYIHLTNVRLLKAMAGVKQGMSLDDVRLEIDSEARLYEWTGTENDIPEARYRSIKYMGFLTSRNVVIYFDENKKVIWVTWEST